MSAKPSPPIQVAKRRGAPRASIGVVAGSILVAWILALALENLGVGLGYRALFIAPWEMGLARLYASPLFLVALFPFAFVLAVLARAAAKPSALFALTMSFAAAVLWGTTTGRHFAALPVRFAFVGFGALALGGGAAIAILWIGRLGPGARARLFALAAILAWGADAFVLPRLYPAFHAGLFVVELVAAAAVSVAWIGRGAAVFGFVVAALAVPLAYRAPKKLAGADNLRLILVDHAPWLGRSVVAAARITPPAPLDEDSSVTARPGEVARALDWTGRDIVLVSIDATRADHVSAYGYGRKTTPNIDRIAERGALFTHAYCATPHTSYSVTSMMTGKYMRPLLTLGLGDDSDTWAGLLRRYGFKTAAFYPPAVFFIDEPRFTTFRDRSLDFEYRKVEFAAPDVRRAQIERYLASDEAVQGGEKPLFLWLHLFEPHEPYVNHPDHAFGGADAKDEDAYDSEIAEADALVGWLEARMNERAKARGKGPSGDRAPVFVVTADHGEEFGDHGGRYHGTTVYEEQVRVPLVIAGPGVSKRRIEEPVQTIDLLPTALSALGIPRPARVRGRDLGPILAGKAPPSDGGYAYAETEDFTLLAEGSDRLVCRRKLAACALYDVSGDPKEQSDIAAASPERVKKLRARTAAVERDHGRYEHGSASELPEALRRGLAGDLEVSEEAASLLDDVKVEVRRKAGEVAYRLHDPRTIPSLSRSLSRESDLETKRWVALALVRAKEAPSALAEELVTSPEVPWQRFAALAFASVGDRRGEAALVGWWGAPDVDFERARELLAAFAAIRSRRAVPALVKTLDDARLRPYLADTLATIGDAEARRPLLASLSEERYASLRPGLGRALVALGTKDELRAPLRRFAGMPDPMLEAIEILLEAAALGREPSALVAAPVIRQGADLPAPPAELAGPILPPVAFGLEGPAEGCRLLVVIGTPTSAQPPEGKLGGEGLRFAPGAGRVRVAPVACPSASTRLEVRHPGGVVAAWVVRRVPELPPPAAVPWDAGPETDPEVSDGGDPR